MLLKSFNEASLALVQYLVPFGRKSLGQSRSAPRILRVQLAARFQRPPKWCCLRLSFSLSLSRCVRGNPRENPGCQRTSNRRTMPTRQSFSEFINRCHFPTWHLAHELVHFHRRGNHKRTRPPPLALGLADRTDPWKALVIRQFCLPTLPFWAHTRILANSRWFIQCKAGCMHCILFLRLTRPAISITETRNRHPIDEPAMT